MRRTTRGFTLIELLVVIGIIAVLAGLLIAGIPLVQRLLHDVQCGNNLQQLATAMEVYRQDHDDAFPGRLRYLVQTGGDLRGLDKLLICPLDQSKGNNEVNREPKAMFGDLDEENYLLSTVWAPERPCSYLYEAGEAKITGSRYDYFYRYFERSGDTPPDPRPPDLPSVPTATDPQYAAYPSWYMAKRVQVRTGNLKDDGVTLGDPFPPSLVPAIRCYWHNRWRGGSDLHTKKRVLNVSWDLNVFWSTPQWEIDINPRIPP